MAICSQNVPWHSSALVLILSFAVLFLLLYASSQTPSSRHPPGIIPEPQITQLQAIQIAEHHLRNQIPDLEEAWLYFGFYNSTSASNKGHVEFSQIKTNPERLQLPLFFLLANGTLYRIDPSTNAVIDSYPPEPNCKNCSAIGFYAIAAAAKDRLVYKFEVAGWKPSPPTMPIPFSGYVIDAETAEIVWNSIDWERSKRPAPRVDIYANATSALDIRELLEMKLNPQETQMVEITKGASVSSQNLDFVPRDIRGILGYDNRVVWENQDTVTHTVSSDDGYSNEHTGKFDGMLEAGQRYEYTFVDVGRYPYHCQIHPFMTGEVEIVPNYA